MARAGEWPVEPGLSRAARLAATPAPPLRPAVVCVGTPGQFPDLCRGGCRLRAVLAGAGTPACARQRIPRMGVASVWLQSLPVDGVERGWGGNDRPGFADGGLPAARVG